MSQRLSETGEPYVPEDYAGPVAPCRVCGNPAPIRRVFAPGGSVTAHEGSPCFIGGILIAVASPSERATLIANLEDEEQ